MRQYYVWLTTILISLFTFAQSWWVIDIQLLDTPMYEQIHLPDMIKGITTCKEDVTLSNQLKSWLDRAIVSMAPHRQLALTKAVYHRAHFYANEYSKNNHDCNKLMSVLQLMDYSRDVHIKIMEQYDMLIDFTDININKIHGYDIKKNIVADALKKFTISNIHNININYSQEQFVPTKWNEAKFMKDMKTLINNTIYKVYDRMYNEGMIQDADISQLNNTTIVQYTPGCSDFHGLYRIKQTFDQNGKKVNQQVQEMKVLLNVCYNYHIIQDIQQVFEKIVIHELGHHMYYRKDIDPLRYNKICRIDVNKRNNACTNTDFVSDYARTNALEDYAEQFMYSYLDIAPTTTPKE